MGTFSWERPPATGIDSTCTPLHRIEAIFPAREHYSRTVASRNARNFRLREG